MEICVLKITTWKVLLLNQNDHQVMLNMWSPRIADVEMLVSSIKNISSWLLPAPVTQMAQSTEALQGPWFLQEGFLCVSESVICSIVYDYQPSSHCPEGMLGTVKDLPISCCMPSCLEYLPTLLSTGPVTVCLPRSCQDSIVHHPPEKMSQRSLSHFWERHKRMGKKICHWD